LNTGSEAPSVGAGMKGGGYYDVHSEYQRRVVAGGEELVRALIAEMKLPTEGAFAIADYGAGTGASSVAAIKAALSALRERAPELPVAAIHNDLPTSDFGQLFHNVAGPDGYLSENAGPVYTMAAAGSFFDQVVPDASVRLGMCSNAAHWFRRQPQVVIPDGMYFSEASGAARGELAEQAADDWLRFLSARAAELQPGGKLLVQGIATTTDDGAVRVSGSRLLHVMWTVLRGLADDGKLDPEFLERYVFPVYCRSAEEATAPVTEGGPLADSVAVETVRVEEVPNPYWEQLEREGDREAYADAYTGFVRAFSESTLVENLFGPGGRGADPAALSDEFLARFRVETARDPEAGRYEAWILRLVLRRK
jgi:hypothetical protein